MPATNPGNLMEIATHRLTICELSDTDAEFILKLVNDPDWIKYIGDRGVRDIEDARQYILNGPVASYREFGFGLFLTKLKNSDTPIGICGLLKRKYLKDVDIGYAFLPEFRNQGYAFEAANAVMNYARSVLGIDTIVAITSPDNHRSIKVLEKLGLRYDRDLKIIDDVCSLYSSAGKSDQSES